MNKSNENFLIIQNAIDMPRNDAFSVLEGEDETLKPLAFINIDEIKNDAEADLIMFHLTNHQSPTREACAHCILNAEGIDFIKSQSHIETLEDAICDINPNVCRAIISLISSNKRLAELIMPVNIKRIKKLLDDFKIYEKEFGACISNKMRNRKNHAKNKKLFNLYWCLEALGETLDANCPYIDEIIEICSVTAYFLDYTIREKTAKILVKIPNAPKELLQKLKNDENFYVKNQVYDKICKDSSYRDTL